MELFRFGEIEEIEGLDPHTYQIIIVIFFESHFPSMKIEFIKNFFVR